MGIIKVQLELELMNFYALQYFLGLVNFGLLLNE